MKLYRALYGDAILVYIVGTPIWRSEINIWNSLLRWKRFLFALELVYMRINTSPNTWNVQTAENHKERPFFEPDSFVAATILVSRKVKILQNLYFQNERRYETGNLYKDLFLGRLQPGVNKISEELPILILGFDDVTVKTICWRTQWWVRFFGKIQIRILVSKNGFCVSLPKSENGLIRN